MAEKTNVPEIRFAGFTDPWEQRKFVDFVEASGIRNKDNLQLESYSVSNDRGFVPQDEQFENGGTMRDADKTAYWIVESGSFAYNPARINVGSIGYQSTRKNVIVSSLYEVFKTDHSCDDRFLWHWFKSSLFTKQIEMLQEGGVRLYFFFDKLQKSEIWMPNVDEQRKIGQQFDQLDSLITLHQRKRRNGPSTHPLVWEQRKLGEFSKKKTTKNADGALSETFTNSAEQGVISQLDYFDHDITNDANISGYYVVQPDDFVYNPRISVTAPCGPINRNRLNRAGVMSPLYTVFSVDTSVDKTYLEHYFKTSRWHDFMFLEGNTGARSDRFSISDATFFEMPIWRPGVSEQMAIAKQLETTDSLITLHQRQLDGNASDIIFLTEAKNRRLDIAKSAVLRLETRSNSPKLLNKHPVQQRFLSIP